jgi:putative transposase
MSFVATTSGITGEDVRDLMVAAVEHRFGPVNRLPVEIEWLTDNGSCYLARETRRFVARSYRLCPIATAACASPGRPKLIFCHCPNAGNRPPGRS